MHIPKFFLLEFKLTKILPLGFNLIADYHIHYILTMLFKFQPSFIVLFLLFPIPKLGFHEMGSFLEFLLDSHIPYLSFGWESNYFLRGFSWNGKLRNGVINYKQGFKYLKKEVSSTQIVVCIMDNGRSSMYII